MTETIGWMMLYTLIVSLAGVLWSIIKWPEEDSIPRGFAVTIGGHIAVFGLALFMMTVILLADFFGFISGV